MSSSELFFALTPERVLAAVAAAGLEPTGRCLALNSFENRVYDIELAGGERVVAKFYRPGRWRAEQILEEHAFIADLDATEIPVCTIRPFPDGSTLREIEGIFYCLADRRGGRAPDELDDRLIERLGMLVARLHNVGASRPARHRWTIGAELYIRQPLAFFAENRAAPWAPAPRLLTRYDLAARELANRADVALASVTTHRVHGDLHRGNLLLRSLPGLGPSRTDSAGVLWLLDFDDMASGPAVQDLWLALPARDREGDRQREIFIEAYQQLRVFDRRQLGLIEHLRSLRMVHYAGWLARRADDPAFQRAWPDFGQEEWWEREVTDLEAQLAVVRGEAPREEEELAPERLRQQADEASELTNKDYFWDWEEPGPKPG